MINFKKLSSVSEESNFVSAESKHFIAEDGGKIVRLPSDMLLPKVSASDNGKILKVVDGAWALVDPS